MAKNSYDVELTNGDVHEVNTDHHHDDHSYDKFKAILANILSGVVSGVLTHHITRITFKGKK